MTEVQYESGKQTKRGKKAEFGHKFKTHGEFLLILCRNDNLLMLKKHIYIYVCVYLS